MKRKFTLFAASSCLWMTSLAQAPCPNDLNGFVASKNVGAVGAYQLQNGIEEKAAQTYMYNESGKIISVRIGGNYPSSMPLSGVPLKIGIYHVDISGRPTTQISSANHIWWSNPDNANGYIDVTFPGGVNVNTNFAITVEIIGGFPYGNVFNLKYTGNTEGLGQDLASLAGSSTGFNWTSSKNSFNKDGDFYLQPTMANTNAPGFTISSICNPINSAITFTNTSSLTKDSMFNKIGGLSYSGSNFLYSWDFGDGSPISHAVNPVHQYATGGVFTTTLTTKIEGWNGVCSKSIAQSVSVGLNVTANNITNVNCFGGNNGSIVANGLAGAPGYLYNLNNGTWQTSANFNNLIEGAYILNVKDSKGCKNNLSFSITQPTSILINPIITTNASCAQANGSFTCNASGGVSPLQYKLNSGAFVSSGIFTNLTSGTYALTVKDANGCLVNTSVIINTNSGPNLNPPSITNVSCNNGNDGSISLSSNGGTGAVMYSINNGLNYQATGNFNGLSAGEYICVVKDNATCINSTIITLTEGPLLNLSVTAKSTLCFGSPNGEIDVVSNGGTGIHTYSLNGINYQSSSHFSGLVNGNYNVYVKDVTGCVKSTSIAVNQPNALSVTLNLNAASCYGSETGTIAAIANGGIANYAYSLDGENFQGTGEFENLSAGNYTLFILDQNQCALETSFSITEPAAITSLVNTTNATCTSTNGSIMVVASGGSGAGYTYSNDGINFVASGLFSNLAAGTQFIVIKDGAGCMLTVSGVIVSAGGPSIASSSSQNISCFDGTDGTITISSVTGGTGTILYSKDGVNFQSSNVFSGLSAGTYLMQVKDANGCIASVTKVLTQPNAFLVNSTLNQITCFGDASGSIAIVASGGAGFFAYSINNGVTYQASANFINLTAGVYDVIIKDAANCSTTTHVVLTQPTQIQLNTSALNVSCHGLSDGEINVTSTGGLAPYTYGLDGINYSSNSSFTGLSGNNDYLIFVKDANNCVVHITQTIVEPAILNVLPFIQNVTCAGGSNGFIILTVSGGVNPYQYDWTNNQNTSSNTNLTAGNYAVNITDFNGCTHLSNFSITEPNAPIIINGIVTASNTNSSADGSIDVTVNGGTSPYSFSWSNGMVTEDLQSLNPGAYLLTITDANGCAVSNTFIVSNVAGLETITTIDNVDLYPNPANKYITIDANQKQMDELNLFSITGEHILNVKVDSNTYLLTIEELSAGIYFIKINVGNQIITKRFEVRK